MNKPTYIKKYTINPKENQDVLQLFYKIASIDRQGDMSDWAQEQKTSIFSEIAGKLLKNNNHSQPNQRSCNE